MMIKKYLLVAAISIVHLCSMPASAGVYKYQDENGKWHFTDKPPKDISASSVTISTRDDLEQIDAGMLLYDAFYRWARDATDESHDWPQPDSRG